MERSCSLRLFGQSEAAAQRVVLFRCVTLLSAIYAEQALGVPHTSAAGITMRGVRTVKKSGYGLKRSECLTVLKRQPPPATPTQTPLLARTRMLRQARTRSLAHKRAHSRTHRCARTQRSSPGDDVLLRREGVVVYEESADRNAACGRTGRWAASVSMPHMPCYRGCSIPFYPWFASLPVSSTVAR